MHLSRRRLLAATAGATTAGGLSGLAGCTGAGTDGGSGDGGGGEPTEAPTASPTETGMDGPTVAVTSHPTFGDILADGAGNVLYLFTPDPAGESVCTGGCAEAWPPLTVESEMDLEAGGGVEASLSTVERDDGSLHVTADDVPLYYFVRDEAPGDALGQEVNNVWFVLRPDASAVKPTVSARTVDPLGDVLTDADGMTLYLFTPDPAGESVCTGGCAEAWPPLTVESEMDLEAGGGVEASLSTVERDDGSLHVTADDVPLYYFVRDEGRDDVEGQEVNNVWFVLRPDGAAVKPTVSVREHPDYGPILTDADGMTLYLFANDDGTTSNCTGGCAEAWPPLEVDGPDALFESVLTDVALGTTEHPEVGTMATAAGHPLYYFQNDEERGDANGQGLNDVWFVLDPDGNPVGM